MSAQIHKLRAKLKPPAPPPAPTPTPPVDDPPPIPDEPVGDTEAPSTVPLPDDTNTPDPSPFAGAPGTRFDGAAPTTSTQSEPKFNQRVYAYISSLPRGEQDKAKRALRRDFAMATKQEACDRALESSRAALPGVRDSTVPARAGQPAATSLLWPGRHCPSLCDAHVLRINRYPVQYRFSWSCDLVRQFGWNFGSIPHSFPQSVWSNSPAPARVPSQNSSRFERRLTVGDDQTTPTTTPTSTRALPLGETTDAPADTPGLRAAVPSWRRTSRRVAAGEGGPVNVYGTEALCTCRVQLVA